MKKLYPGADRVLYDVEANQVYITYKDHPEKDFTRTLSFESQYLPMLAEAYEIPDLKKVTVDLLTSIVTLEGMTKTIHI